MARSLMIPVGAVLVLLAGCGGADVATVTSTVQTTVTATDLVTATATATAVETTVTTATTTTTTTSVVPVTAAARPDPDTPGPDDGPACPVDPAYRDESTDGLAADVVAAWTGARTAAAAAGVSLCVNDGKRSRAQQQATFAEYVAQYGQAAAEQYVLPPEKSAHVAGYAVDVQPAASAAWLEATNGSLGFCRMYDNEVWHFEFAETFRLGCPPRRAAPEG